MLDAKLLDILVCPADRGPLIYTGAELYNPRLRRAYRIEDGIPVLLVGGQGLTGSNNTVLGVGGHVGLIRAGRLGQRRVMVLAGRKHAYETGEADGMKGAVRTLAAAALDDDLPHAAVSCGLVRSGPGAANLAAALVFVE